MHLQSLKPLLEKRRRARINDSLSQLKGLILPLLGREVSAGDPAGSAPRERSGGLGSARRGLEADALRRGQRGGRALGPQGRNQGALTEDRTQRAGR